MTELKEHIKITSGFALDSNLFSKTEGFPVIRIRDVDRGFSETYYEGECDKKYIVKNGDLLVTMDGEFRAKIWNGGDAYLNQRVCKVEADEVKLSGRYLKYVLPKKLKEIEDRTAFVTVKHLSVNDIKGIEVYLPSFGDQERIANLLDKANAIRQKRRETLRLADEFLCSTFLEMFGDPIKNPKGWPEVNFEQVLYLQRGFDLPISERNSNGKVAVYGSNGILGYHNIAKVKGGGVITGRSGTIGKVHYTLKDYWPLNTTLFSKDLKGNNIIFLSYMLRLFRLERFDNGTGVPTLNRNLVHREKIYKIDISLQNKFASIVEKTDKLKRNYEQSLQESQNLFNSLMQRAFRGEL